MSFPGRGKWDLENPKKHSYAVYFDASVLKNTHTPFILTRLPQKTLVRRLFWRKCLEKHSYAVYFDSTSLEKTHTPLIPAQLPRKTLFRHLFRLNFLGKHFFTTFFDRSVSVEARGRYFQPQQLPMRALPRPETMKMYEGIAIHFDRTQMTRIRRIYTDFLFFYHLSSNIYHLFS